MILLSCALAIATSAPAQNKDWWGIKEGLYTGNADTLDYRPISNSATRMSALRSGELDFVLDPAVQDVPRMRTDPALKIWEGVELRVVMIGMDQWRDELLYSDVKGRNPFKDKRVRLAMYQGVDIEALKTQVMRGLSSPTGIPLPSPKGFGFTLHCPNDRYVNDERICIALAGMWARIGLNVKIETVPKTQYFQKAQKMDVSAYMVGWGGAVQDAIFTLKPLMRQQHAAALHGQDAVGVREKA